MRHELGPGQVVRTYWDKVGTILRPSEVQTGRAVKGEKEWIVDFGTWQGVFLDHELRPKNGPLHP